MKHPIDHPFAVATHTADKHFDIIGDIHGCAHSLSLLLERLGYSEQRGCYRHVSRQVVFVGDIIDRGPEIRRCLQIVKAMVDAGCAQIVMGNHELHALARARLPAGISFNDGLMKETLEQFKHYTDEWQVYIEWFASLPVFLDLGSCRVVHACWDQAMIDEYLSLYDSAIPSPEFLQQAFERGSFASRFLDRLTRGTVLPMPEGRELIGRDGLIRRVFRTKFWALQPTTYNDVVFQPDPLPNDIASQPLGEQDRLKLLAYDPSWPPVFVGHYWLSGEPQPVSENIACLDYSAVKLGKLVAYRFDGEQKINKDKFVWVEVAKENLNNLMQESPI